MVGRFLEIGVIGCGVGGQAVASLLADAGHRVTVMERFAEARPIGAGLLLQPTGLAVLDRLDGRTAAGRRVIDLQYSALHPAAYGLGLHRGALFSLLHGRLHESAARLLTGLEIVDIERDGAHATALDRAGRRYGPFDLLVIADGAHSALRDRIGLTGRAPVYPWGCVWAVGPDPGGGHSPVPWPNASARPPA